MHPLFSKANAVIEVERFPNETAVRISWREILPTRDCQKQKTKARRRLGHPGQYHLRQQMGSRRALTKQ